MCIGQYKSHIYQMSKFKRNGAKSKGNSRLLFDKQIGRYNIHIVKITKLGLNFLFMILFLFLQHMF